MRVGGVRYAVLCTKLDYFRQSEIPDKRKYRSDQGLKSVLEALGVLVLA